LIVRGLTSSRFQFRCPLADGAKTCRRYATDRLREGLPIGREMRAIVQEFSVWIQEAGGARGWKPEPADFR
jgi:hypothetical protein